MKWFEYKTPEAKYICPIHGKTQAINSPLVLNENGEPIKFCIHCIIEKLKELGVTQL